jgi:hypothetical protein
VVVCGGDVGGVDATGAVGAGAVVGAVAGAVAVAVDATFPRLEPTTLKILRVMM